MKWFDRAIDYVKDFSTYFPTMNWRDLLEIVIIALLLYYLLVWMKTTRAWALMKGILVIGAFLLVADLFGLDTILWLAQKIFTFAVIALIVVLQPELRVALENLGKKNLFTSLFPFETGRKEEAVFSEKTIGEITKACVEMSKVKTGALIVIEQQVNLKEYERTGIDVDGIVTSQLLLNIFEHNTPLHDGAVIVRGNRVTSATCYLPLSDNLSLSKELGTRHRAGVGISEVSDALTIIVSEETGIISVAHEGILFRNLSAEELRERMQKILNKGGETAGSKNLLSKNLQKWKGRSRSLK